MAQLTRGRRLMGDINVVPYIDVMLVLLIIFLIFAGVYRAVTNFRLAIAVALILAALALLLSNLLGYLRRR